MNDPRMMSLPYRNSPPSRRQYELARQRQRATYDRYEYDYDAMPAGSPRTRPPMDMPRSHPTQFTDDTQQRRVSGSTSSQQRLPFDEAARRLHRVLKDSQMFYINFHRGYLNEIKGVQEYANAKVLEHLWRCKIETAMSKAVKTSNDPTKQAVPNFQSTSEQLGRALVVATQSVPRRASRSESPVPGNEMTKANVEDEIDSMKRLIKKMNGQHQDLAELIHGIYRSSRKMGELIQDINLLLQVLDGSKDLWVELPGQEQPGQEQPPPPPPGFGY